MMLPFERPARAMWPLLVLVTPLMALGSQEVRGTVVDSTVRTPIIGAVVQTMDSTGTTLSRGLTDELGAYVIGRPAGVRRLRVVRMGYRPREVEVPPMSGVEQRLDIAMTAVPTFLSAVVATVAPNCPRRADSQRAFGLLEQARIGLLATVVSREVNPPAVKILRFERTSEGGDHRIQHQSVRLDSIEAVSTPFSAVHSAERFARDGFISDSAENYLYFGPDADVMLDPNFASAYCFQVRPGRTAGEIGLGFTPASSKKGRIDIEGTLWVDSVAKVVRQIAFEYVGVDRTMLIKPGGEISFRQMPNGSVVIDRWFFRMMGARVDTASGSSGNKVTLTYRVQREAGAELAWARWPDGHVYRASLATVKLRIVNKFDELVTRAVIRLTDTDYSGRPDSMGTVVFDDVLPGPYNVEVEDSALVSQKVIMKSATHFVAERDQLVSRTVVAPPAYMFFRLACAASTTGRWVEYHAMDEKKKSIPVAWKLGEELGSRGEHLRATGVTLRDGIFGYCRDVDERATLSVQLSRLNEPSRGVIVALPATKASVVVPVIVPFRSFARR